MVLFMVDTVGDTQYGTSRIYPTMWQNVKDVKARGAIEELSPVTALLQEDVNHYTRRTSHPSLDR